MFWHSWNLQAPDTGVGRDLAWGWQVLHRKRFGLPRVHLPWCHFERPGESFLHALSVLSQHHGILRLLETFLHALSVLSQHHGILRLPKTMKFVIPMRPSWTKCAMMFRLYLNIMAYVVQECRKGIANFIVVGECIHLRGSVESGSAWTVVHMGMYGECLVAPNQISDVIHLQTLICWGKNCAFSRVARLASSMLLSVMLDFLLAFFWWAIFYNLSFFESVMFCLSVVILVF